MIPLYGFLAGDTLGLLIFAYEADTIADLTQRLEKAASIRVKLPVGPRSLIYRKRKLAPGLTLAEVGMKALERFDVREGSDHEL